MIAYKNCYIAFLDLLGFKNLIDNKSCQEITQLFSEIETEYIVIDETTQKPLVSIGAIKRKVMSDSICFYIDAEEKNSLAGLLAVCNYFQVCMLRLQEPVLCRGAIVRGDIYAKGDITFGPGLTKAYLLEEKVANTPRIIIAKSVVDDWKNYDESGEFYVKKFLFRDSDALLVSDYLFLFYGLAHEHNAWKDFTKHVVHRLDCEQEPRIRNKYLYIEHNFQRVTQKYMDNREVFGDA